MVNKRILSRKKLDHVGFVVGDLVLRYKDVIASNMSTKLEDRYEGPYIVQECHKNSTYILKTLDGNIAQRHIHGNKLKIYKSPKVSFNPDYFNSNIDPNGANYPTSITRTFL